MKKLTIELSDEIFQLIADTAYVLGESPSQVAEDIIITTIENIRKEQE